MKRSARTLCVLLLTALWLPVQGVALLIMPLAMLAGAAQAADSAAHEMAMDEMPCHAMGAAAGDASAGPGDDSGVPCHQCSLCQHACAGYAAHAGATASWLAAHPLPPAQDVARLSGRIAEPPDHPPRITH